MDETALKALRSPPPKGTTRAATVNLTTLHPYVSSVLYLDDGGSSGAPTLVMDQQLDGNRSDCAWTCAPKTGRLLLFNGRLLHGVVPHIHPDRIAGPRGPRLTLMIGWWGRHVHTVPYAAGRQLPNMLMPSPLTGTGKAASWPALFGPLKKKKVQQLAAHSDRVVTARDGIRETSGSRVWECLYTDGDKAEDTNDGADSLVDSLRGIRDKLQDSGVVFVGNWFLRSEHEINDEILAPTVEHDDSNQDLLHKVDDNRECENSDIGWISVADLARMRG